MSKKKVFINVNGCPRRELDSSRLGAYFKFNKFELVGTPQEADYIIFVTCSFKESKEKECWEYIETYQKYRGELIVVGCLPEIAPIKFNQKFKGRYVSTKNLNEIDQFFNKFKIKFKDIPDAHQSFTFLNEYAYLRICDGCIERCAYCCIYRAVGKLRSKSIQACVKEYKDILWSGYRKIIIVADNVGAYGLDIKSSLPELLNHLSTASNEEVHWYIQELHPRWVILYKAELLKMAEEKKIREILCAIQSGSNRLLKLMNRHHSIEEIKGVFLELKKVNPDLRLYTQVIIGFPSETEEDFRKTLNVIKEIQFQVVSLYPYYDGYDTIASKMDGKIDKATITRRVQEAIDFLNLEGIGVFYDGDDLDLKK